MRSLSTEEREWLDRAYAAIEASGANVAAIRLSAESHLDSPPVLALVGPYTSGKSSLIKRLCIDDGVEIPESLLIGGEPTTQGSTDVQIGRWVLRDTPGVDSENEDHAGVAVRAALSAERVFLLVLPNLFAEDSETADLLRALAPGTVDVLLSHADQPVMTPDPESIATWASRKAEEVRRLAARLGHPRVRVFAVAADPRARVGNRPADRTRYDGTRDWDGVAAIRALLEEPCPDAVRAATVFRIVCAGLDEASQALGRSRLSVRRRLDEQEQAIECESGRAEKLRELRASARSELKERLVQAARSGPAPSARSRILVAANDWLDDWDDRLFKAATDWELEAVSWRGDLSFVSEVPGHAPGSKRAGPDLDTQEAEQLIRDGLSGLTVDPARIKELDDQIKGWQRANRKRDYYGSKETPFGSIGEVREARKELQRLRKRQTAFAVGQVALDSLIQEEKLRRQAKEQAEAERIQLEMAQALAVDIARVLFDGPSDGTPGFDSMFESLREQLGERKQQILSQVTADEEELARLEAIQQQLTALREAAPPARA